MNWSGWPIVHIKKDLPQHWEMEERPVKWTWETMMKKTKLLDKYVLSWNDKTSKFSLN